MIAGIGNIYASEILFRAEFCPPGRRGNFPAGMRPSLESVREILKQAIANGGSTLHDYHRPDGGLGYFQNLHCVYNKAGKPCPGCTCAAGHDDRGIRKIVPGRPFNLLLPGETKVVTLFKKYICFGPAAAGRGPMADPDRPGRRGRIC